MGPFWSALLQAGLGAASSALGPTPAEPPPNDAGVQSAMGGTAPAPLQENPVGGSTFKDLVQTGISKGVSSLIGAKVNRWQASMAGKDNRAYMDSAFPELNPWELAGASATNSGVGMAGQDVQGIMQDKELATRKLMQDEQIGLARYQTAAQERMNAVSAAAGVESARVGTGPSWAMVPSNVALAEANRERTTAETYRTGEEATATRDANTRAWFKDIPTILMAGESANAGVAGPDRNFQGKALGAKFAGAVANGVGSFLGKGVPFWTKKRRSPSGSVGSPEYDVVE